MYDIFYISKESGIDDSWNRIHSKYPNSQRLTDIKDFDQIRNRSFTKMFWVIWDDLILNDQFDLTEYRATKWDDTYVHIFKNGEYYDGICLFPKNIKLSKKEFEHRFFTEKKEVDIQASVPNSYDKFYINTYDEYLNAIKNSTTEMFWVVWDDIVINNDFKFDYRIPYYDFFHKNITHIFKNNEYYDGVCLFSKNTKITKKEFEHRFFIEKKEVDIHASTPRLYDKFNISTYEEYLEALKNSKTEMFWVIWPEIEIIDNTVFDIYFNPRDGKYDHDRSENHIFKNLCNGIDSYYNGLVLFSKNKVVSSREFNRRYLIDKKEHDRLVSAYRYPRHLLESYDGYLEILKKETQPLFWGIWPEIEITDNTIFDFYFDPRDGKYDHDRNENHIFKNIFRSQESYSYGAVLFSKNKKIGKREFDHRYLVEKKEHDRVISKLKPYDIIFISYEEPNADENYQKLLNRFPRSKRIHKVKGIHQAHIKAAELASTEMFWVVDGDAIILESFNFDHEITTYERDIVHVWRSQNPINDLVYGYGGVKLLPRELTLAVDVTSSDMTTSISKNFKAIPAISNITAFNTDPFNTWKSAFRECVKLSSKIIDRQKNDETDKRLNIWCTEGKDKLFGEFAIDGANKGRMFGEKNKNNPDELKRINDFDWLRKIFDERCEKI